MRQVTPMTATEDPIQGVGHAAGRAEQSPIQTLSGILQATAASLAAARAVMETAAQTAFTFFAEANDTDRSLLMGELSETALVHDAILAGYAKALDSGTEGGSTLAKQLGYRSVADLLQHELGRKKHDTDTIVRLAEVLRDGTYPTLAVALEDGRVSLQQAGVIVGVLDQEVRHHDPETVEHIEAAATDFAVGTDTALPLKPEQLQKLIRSWFRQLQPEKTELDTAEQYELREASYGMTRTGMIRVRALLSAEEGAQVVQFLDANAAPRVRFTDPELREAECCCTDPENQCGATYVTDPASNSDDSGELLVTSHCGTCVPDDPRTRKQKMADAFSKAFSAAAKSKETSTQGSACPTLIVTIPITELDKHAQGVPANAMLQRTEEVVPAHVAARILCDGQIQAAITGADGEVLHLGRAKRLFTPAQRTALTLTYKTCAVGDCDIPAVWTEAHHVQWWSKGGKTDIDNGILLCNYHHHQVHAGKLDIVPDRSDEDTGHRWKVRRRARIRAGTTRPKRANRGSWDGKRVYLTPERPLREVSTENPPTRPENAGRRRARAQTDRPADSADDDTSE